MAEMIVILKLDVDLENISDITGDSNDHILAKIRAHVTTTMGQALTKERYVKLTSSAIAEETDDFDSISGHRLLHIVETSKILDKKTGDMI